MEKVLARKSKAEFQDLDRLMIETQVREVGDEIGVDIKSDKLVGELSEGIFSSEYSWDINKCPESGSFVLVEEIYLQPVWRWVLILSLYSFCVGFCTIGISILSHPVYLLRPYSIPFFGLAFILFALSTAPIISKPNTIVKMRGSYESYIIYSIVDTLFVLLAISTMIVLVSEITGIYGLYFIPAFLTMLTANIYRKHKSIFEEFAEKRAEKIQRILPFHSFSQDRGAQQDLLFHRFSQAWRLPVVSGEYLVLAGLLVGINMFSLFVAAELDSSSVLNFPVTLVIVITQLVFFYEFFRSVTGEAALEAYFNLKQGDSHNIGKVRKLVYFSITIAVSYTGLLLLLIGLDITLFLSEGPSKYFVQYYMSDTVIEVQNVNKLIPYQPVSLIVILSISSLLYFPAGLAFQLYHHLSKIIQLTTTSKRADLDIDTQAFILKTPNSELGPASISTGFTDYIILPEDILSLPDEELLAVIRHEEHHINNKDSLLAMYVPLLGIPLFTGQNIIYSFLDFREREFKADQYAAEKTSNETVIQAIDELGSQNTDRDPNSFMEKLFGLFYSGFAVSESHPTPKERKNNLR